jgi:hypothetical protein
MNIIEFLEARIAEDEAVARGAHYEGQRWYSEEEFVGRYPDCCDCGCEVMMGANRKIEAAHVATWQPARVLAECAAKRRRIQVIQDGWVSYNDDNILGELLEIEALPYKDHPDYRQEWSA